MLLLLVNLWAPAPPMALGKPHEYLSNENGMKRFIFSVRIVCQQRQKGAETEQHTKKYHML